VAALLGFGTETSTDAEVVFDLFHIIKQLSKTIDDIRSSVYRQEKGKSQRKLIKGSRWLLLKNREKLRTDPESAGRSEKQRLEELMELNTPLSQAYILKEQIKQIWERGIGVREANQRLKIWIVDARGWESMRWTGSASSLTHTRRVS